MVLALLLLKSRLFINILLILRFQFYQSIDFNINMTHKCFKSLTMKPMQTILAILWMCTNVCGAPHMDGDRIVGFDDFEEYKVKFDPAQ